MFSKFLFISLGIEHLHLNNFSTFSTESVSFGDKCRLKLINSTKMSKHSENDKSTEHQKVFNSR